MAKRRRYGKFDDKKLGMLRTGKEAAIIALAAIIVLLFVLGISKVSGNSMEPTLHDGQPVIFARLHGTYKAGDVVSLRMANDEYLVKRVVAVAGDTIEIRSGKLYVNGIAESVNYGVTNRAESSTVKYPLTLKEGQIFVLGDNREVSVDSRTFGPIASSQTRGLVLFVK